MQRILGLVFCLIVGIAPSAHAQNWDCFSECMGSQDRVIAGAAHNCNKKCGGKSQTKPKPREDQKSSVTYGDESVGSEEASEEDVEAAMLCIAECYNTGALNEECVEKCPDVKKTKESKEPIEKNAFSSDGKKVNFDCFKSCRIDGDTYENCEKICGK